MFNLSFLNSLLSANGAAADDVDKLNFLVTPAIFLFFAALVSSKQFFGEPIECHIPSTIARSERYVNNVCFIQNTYYIPINEDIPNEADDRKKLAFGYYQWVPFILFIQAFMMYLPRWIWNRCLKKFKVDIKSIHIEVSKIQGQPRDARKEEISKLCKYFNDSYEGVNRKTAVISKAYLILKCVMIFISMFQMIFINIFIGNDSLWALTIFYNFIRGVDWESTGFFPRITLCDFILRDLGSLQSFTVQCVLMVNMINEKIFVFMWFWLAFVMLANIGNIVFVYQFLYDREKRVGYIFNLFDEKLCKKEEFQMNHYRANIFLTERLKTDELLIFYFLKEEFGTIPVAEIILSHYREFLLTYKEELC